MLSLSEEGAEGEAPDDGKTGEQRMLEASRAEIAVQRRRRIVHDDDSGLRLLRDEVLLFLDTYVREPVCTALRFLQLVTIFVPVILTVPAVWIGPRSETHDGERAGTLWWYGFLVQAMERAGPAFIKVSEREMPCLMVKGARSESDNSAYFLIRICLWKQLGQWAASRTDIFPTEMCEIMSKLHAHAPAHSMAVTRRTIERAFDGRTFDDIFEEFDETPLGVGAIAQVYRAKLRPDLVLPESAPADSEALSQPSGSTGANGPASLLTPIAEGARKQVEAALTRTRRPSPAVPSSYVAVKVLHPDIERTVRRDLRIMWLFATLLNAVPTMEWLSFPDEVDQFGEMMRLQLDLRIEAANLSHFRRNFRDRTTVWFPMAFTDLTTRDVLVEEFATGIPLSGFLANGGGVFQRDIASEGLDAFLRMLLLDNFVHADLHPGNIMVRFYKAEQTRLSLPQLGLGSGGSRSSHDEEDDASSLAHRPLQSERVSLADATDAAAERLRPHWRNSKAWREELQRLEHEGFRPQLVFLDTGLVTELSAVNRRNFLDLFRAVAEFDGYRAGELMCERCRQPEAVLDAHVFALRMQHLVLGVKTRTLALGSVRIGDILHEVLTMVRAHHVRLEGDFVNVVISIMLLEGIGRSLDPSLDLLSSSLPILRQLGAQQGRGMVMGGDYSMMLVWLGLETRRFMQASIEDVSERLGFLSPLVHALGAPCDD